MVNYLLVKLLKYIASLEFWDMYVEHILYFT